MIYRVNKYIQLFFVIAIVSLGIGCKHYADPPTPSEEYSPTGNVNSKRKVLLVSLDGVSGDILSNLHDPTIDSLLATSKYTFNQSLELVNTDPSGWKSMMSGTSYSKHGVMDSTFTPEAVGDGGFENGTPPYYPTFLTYIGQLKSDLNVYTITPWERLSSVLFREYGDPYVTSNDQVTTDSAISVLQKKNTDVVIVDYNSANLIGKSSGYTTSNNNYISAVRTLTGYTAELLNAIKSRSDYDAEEWLVILTTDQGGIGNGGQDLKGFQILSNKYFTGEEVKNNAMLSVAFKGKESSATTATAVDSLSQFDLGPVTKKMTISLKINVNPDASYNWPTFFSKRKSINTGVNNPGWCFFLEKDFWQFAIANSGGSTLQLAGSSIVDGRWHDVTAVIDYDGSKRTIKTYTDGKFNTSKDITSMGSMISPNDLVIGYIPQYSPSAPIFEVADIRIFNTALSDADVQANTCLTDISTHPYVNNLKAYWRCDEGIGSRYKSQKAGVGDFWFHNSYAWINVDDFPCSYVTPSSADMNKVSIIAQSADVATNVLAWLRIDIDTKWSMDGNAWITNFASEYLKK